MSTYINPNEKKKPPLRKILLAAVCFAVGFLLLLVFVVPYFIPWTELNCRHEDIDLTCGRKRTQYYLFWLNVWNKVEETEGSRLCRLYIGEPGAPKWGRVNTCLPGKNVSPHHAYHSAFGLMSGVIEGAREYGLDQEEWRRLLAGFFKALQKGSNDREARDYSTGLIKNSYQPPSEIEEW